MSFKQLGLSKAIVDAVADKGYQTPSAIQAKSIPLILSQQNLMASAQTGTGKTASFTLPILELLQNNPASHQQIRTLILAPTRGDCLL